MRLKQIAMISLTGASDTTPARASAKGWQKLPRKSAFKLSDLNIDENHQGAPLEPRDQ